MIIHQHAEYIRRRGSLRSAGVGPGLMSGARKSFSKAASGKDSLSDYVNEVFLQCLVSFSLLPTFLAAF